MRSFRPTPSEERWLQIFARVRTKRAAAWFAERIGGWVTASIAARCAFFVLALLAAGLIAAILRLLGIPGVLLLAGLLSVGIAEYLIIAKRRFGTGVEEALELAGVLMLVVRFMDVRIGPTDLFLSALIALALLLTGLRLLNPLFITVAAIASSATVSFGCELVHGSPLLNATVASIYCLGAASFALSLGNLEFRRPSYDRMCNWLLVSMPPVAFTWFEMHTALWPVGLPVQTGYLVSYLPLILLALFGLTALKIGIRRRAHAPILAFMVCAGCLGFHFRNLTSLPLDAKLIAWGSLLLLVAMGLNRYLRTPRAGITSSQTVSRKGLLDAVELVSTSALAPVSSPQGEQPFEGGGGKFGGGGASGTY